MKTLIRYHKSSNLQLQAGFALVATLSLMILLTLVAVGMLGLSAVSLRSSSQAMAQSEARANARLALMLAIGELQKQLGPDQRISVTADQRIKPDGDGSESSAAVGNRYWTGVYDSWPATSDTRSDPMFRSWLVSGNPGQVSQPASADAALAGANAIELVSSGTLGAAGDGLVKAPAMDITLGGVKVGRMAWWVGDQGVKAAIATPPPSDETSLGALRNGIAIRTPQCLRTRRRGRHETFRRSRDR